MDDDRDDGREEVRCFECGAPCLRGLYEPTLCDSHWSAEYLVGLGTDAQAH